MIVLRRLTVILLMEFSIKLHLIKSGWSILNIEGSQVMISDKIVFISLKIDFVLASSADTDESRIMQHFICVLPDKEKTCRSLSGHLNLTILKEFVDYRHYTVN